MPHTESAWKRMRKTEKRRRRNRAAAKLLKAKRKEIADAFGGKDKTVVETAMKTVQATLDRAANKGYIHPNKAARLKSRLVKRTRAAAAAPAK
ncbi:MAG: 30S ribosomal protein S20 [Gemmataceae bacterium]